MAGSKEGATAPAPRRPVGSWRAPRSEANRRTRRARRIFAAVGVFALAGFFAYLLWAPFAVPRTVLVVARPPHVGGIEAKAAFAERDLTAISEAVGGSLIGPPIDLTSDDAPSDLFGPQLRAASPDCDVLLLLVRANAAVENGRAVLLWGAGGHGTESRSYPLGDLIAGLATHRAAVKVLLLDVADAGPDRRAGRLDGDLAAALGEECRRSGEGVWVLTPCSSGERPHDSFALRRSVFGYWLGRGLGGAADRDRDGLVSLSELEAFVSGGVSEWVKRTTGGRESQTPAVIACGRGGTPGDPPLLPAQRSFRGMSEDAALAAEFAEADAARLKEEEATVGTDGARPSGDAAAKAAPASGGGKPAQGGAPAAAEAAAPATAAPQGAAAKPQAALSAADLLKAGWMVRDDLEAGRAVRPDPRRDAPHLWRAYVERLSGLEAAVLTGSADGRTAATDELRRSVVPLGRWAAGGEADPDAAEPVRSLMMAPPNGPLWPAASFGLEEARAADSGNPLAADIASVIAEYDRLISGDDRAAFAKWLSEVPPATRLYREVSLASRLMSDPRLDWSVVRQALAVRRKAERLASTPEAAEWLWPAVEDADVLRRAAERLLLDGVGHNRRTVAVELLAQADSRYAAVAGDLERIKTATALRNELFQIAPDVVAWRRASHGLGGPRSPDAGTVASLLDVAARLSAALDAADPAKIGQVKENATEAAALLANVRSGVSSDYIREALVVPPDPPEDFLRADALLATSLPAADDREALISFRARVERPLVAGPFPLGPRPPSVSASIPAEGDLREVVELEYRLAALAAGGPTSEAFERLGSARRAILEEGRDAGDGVSAARAEFESAVEEFWRRALPAAVSMASAPSSAPAGRRDRLHAVDRALRLLDARDALRVPKFPTAALRDETWSAVLAWQARRTGFDAAAAPAGERESLTQETTSLLDAAARLSGREMKMSAPDVVAVEGTDHVALESSASAPAAFSIRNVSADPIDVWLVVDYAPDLVAIDAPSEVLTPAYRLLRQIGARSSGTVEPAELDRPDRQADVPPTFRLAAGGSREVTFRVSRRSGGDPTRVVLRSIAKPVTYEGDPLAAAIARNDVAVDLPSLAPAMLVVEGAPGTVAGPPGAPILAPFPNTVTPYRVLLMRTSGGAAAVDVALFAARSDPGRLAGSSSAVELPAAVAVDPATAAGVLARWTDGVPLFAATEFPLPADGTPAALPFPKQVAQGAVPGPAVESGLLVVLTDRATGRRSFQFVEVRPQHPRRYLEPSVTYDAETGRIEVDVVPRAGASLPAGGSRVTCEIVEALPPEAARRLEGGVEPGGPAARLFADVSGLREPVTLRVSADGYPRAFLYRVSLAETRGDFLPVTETAIRILAPVPGAAFRSPMAGVPVALQIDAPAGARGTGDLIEVGLDRDRDRELEGEATVRLATDREVTASVRELGPMGLLAVETRAGDFRLNLPAEDLARGRVNVIGRVVAGGRETWSDPVEVVFDDEPPSVTRVLLGSRRVVAGTPLRVSVEASDGDLSGVAQVLVGADVDRTGEFSPKAAPAAAGVVNGRWIAPLDTASLVPGPYYVLVRAVDRVGNAGEYFRQRFEVVTPEQLAAERVAAVNEVSGFVTYRGRIMAGFEVTIEPLPLPDPSQPKRPTAAPAPAPPTSPVAIPAVRTDGTGAFAFPRVPPGRYRVAAKGIHANRTRVGVAEVAVAPSPAEMPPVEVEVDPR